MTRATLLHVLAHPTALGLAEVRELELLAQAFPYCQTAHLLLAKAAHDQGTMLAGQRLRRAATYAADRTLLRRLIEQAAPIAVAEEVPAAAETEPAAATQIAVAVPELVAPLAAESLAPVETADATATAEPEEAVPVATVIPAENELITTSEPAPLAKVAEEPEITPPSPALAETAETPEPEEAPAAPAETAADAWQPEAQPALEALPPLVEQEAAPGLVLVDLEDAVIVSTVASAEKFQQPEPDDEAPPPAQAPAIRPPVEVGEARFEFGLAEPPVPPAPTYELPGLVDEWAASAVTRGLGSPDLVAPAAAQVPAAPVFTPAAFTGDETIGYGYSESSRLGFSLQLLNLLTTKAEAAESAFASTAAAQPPAERLPPVGAFFEPDPLLLDHWATHCPALPTRPSSLDLINNFLRRQPRLTRPAMLPPAPGIQADLSTRSTRVEPELVSEGLARILVRQGKMTRAIEIYEKLMVKQPEKMAYFAAQIQQLQPPA